MAYSIKHASGRTIYLTEIIPDHKGERWRVISIVLGTDGLRPRKLLVQSTTTGHRHERYAHQLSCIITDQQ